VICPYDDSGLFTDDTPALLSLLFTPVHTHTHTDLHIVAQCHSTRPHCKLCETIKCLFFTSNKKM